MAGQRSLDKVSTSEKGQPGGVCPLGADGKVASKYIDWLSASGGVTLDQNGFIPARYIRQGDGSGLDAEYLGGHPAVDFAPAETTIAVNYPLQGGGDLRSGRVVIGLAEDVLNETLDHTKMLNIGINTHGQIDSFIESSAAELNSLQFIDAQVSFDAPSLNNGSSYIKTGISAPGVEIGDFVMVSAPEDILGMLINGYVSGADTCAITINNFTGATIDTGSGTWHLRIMKRVPNS